ncbi:encapsulin [Thermogladius sp. 4427co]|uniref:encapsulin n=1 Tax=Thermogladius sp. 4427co TaxID=3450718 RepID=UPI003F78FC6B
MLSKHPLDISPGKKLTGEELVDAIRLAIIAELDAINLYLQIARSTDDEKVKKVFEDVANEEKTHVGEFLALLKSYDPKQVEELVKGGEEVESLTGLRVGEKTGKKGDDDSALDSFIKLVSDNLRAFLEDQRILSKKIKTLNLGPGTESVPVETIRDGKVERRIERLTDISARFRISQKDIEYHKKFNVLPEMTEAYNAISQIVAEEERFIIETLSSNAGSVIKIGPWDAPGESVRDIAQGVSELVKKGARKPIILILNPSRFVKLLSVSERLGISDLDRVRQLVDDVVVHPLIPVDECILLSTQNNVVDIVYGSNGSIEYIGPEDGYQAFRAITSLAVRIKDPSKIVLLKAM